MKAKKQLERMKYMKRRSMKIVAVFISCLVLFGCAQSTVDNIDQPNQDNNSTGTVLAGAEKEKNIKFEDVKSIQLYDIEGNPLERLYTEEFKRDVVEAWNDSWIDDTSYIEIITGYKMVITLKDDNTINIISYGNKERIVATMNDTTYHLACPEIGEILLDNTSPVDK